MPERARKYRQWTPGERERLEPFVAYYERISWQELQHQFPDRGLQQLRSYLNNERKRRGIHRNLMRRSTSQSTTSQQSELEKLLSRFLQFPFVNQIILNGGMITQNPFADQMQLRSFATLVSRLQEQHEADPRGLGVLSQVRFPELL